MTAIQPNTIVLHVTGMHCPTCEVLIEDRFRQVPGVSTATVSLRKAQARIEHDGTVTSDILRAALRDEDYRLHDKPIANEAEKQEFAVIIFLALSIGGSVLFLKAQGLVPDITIPDKLSYGLAFLIGLVASVSTCMAVAGGLLLALVARYNESHAHLPASARLTPHIFFNVGRILSYTGFGAAIGALGSSFSLPPIANAVLLLAAALVMLVLGLRMLNILSSTHWLMPSMPKAFARRIQASRASTTGSAFAFGASTFFLPCGFTQALQLYVLAQGSASTGALIMLAFSLGTLPALLSLSAVSSLATGAIQRRFVRFSGAAVVVVALISLHSAWTLAVSSGFVSAPSEANAPSTAATLVDGKQVVTMSVVGLDYYPNVFRVVAGTPVEWHIDSTQARGCARMLIAPGLDVRTILSATEPDIVTFTPLTPGEYAFNCGMGMMPANSRFIVVPKA